MPEQAGNCPRTMVSKSIVSQDKPQGPYTERGMCTKEVLVECLFNKMLEAFRNHVQEDLVTFPLTFPPYICVSQSLDYSVATSTGDSKYYRGPKVCICNHVHRCSGIEQAHVCAYQTM